LDIEIEIEIEMAHLQKHGLTCKKHLLVKKYLGKKQLIQARLRTLQTIVHYIFWDEKL
jgi:hypothetical protein